MAQTEAGSSQNMVKGMPWWVFLITGIAWVLISVIVLRYPDQPGMSVATVGILIGVLFLFACINEFLAAARVEGWKWLHVLLGILFAFGALWGFFRPYDTFFALASILGLLFVLWGTFTIIESAATRDTNHLWGLGLAAGILEILLGIWASQQFFPARAELILLWVGFMAMFRGIGEMVLAFHMKRLERA